MEDVAARAGVSRALVSIVFRDQPGASAQTRRRILAAADRIGYRPDHRARLLGRKHTGLVGVSFGVRHTFHGDLVEALYATAEARGFEVALSAVTPSRDERTAVDALQAYRCEALILLGPALSEDELMALGRHVPVVTVARSLSSQAWSTGRVNVVRTDDSAGAALAVEQLVELGHTEVWHVDGGRAPGATERRRGYRAAMKRAGLAAHVLAGGQTEERGAASAELLLSERRPPTAVTVFNDRSAVGLLDTLRRGGIHAPADISVIGYDDDRVARLPSVDLTTVRQDTARLAVSAVDQAVARLAGGRPRETVIAPELVLRSTTAPLTGHNLADTPPEAGKS